MFVARFLRVAQLRNGPCNMAAKRITHQNNMLSTAIGMRRELWGRCADRFVVVRIRVPAASERRPFAYQLCGVRLFIHCADRYPQIMDFTHCILLVAKYTRRNASKSARCGNYNCKPPPTIWSGSTMTAAMRHIRHETVPRRRCRRETLHVHCIFSGHCYD